MRESRRLKLVISYDGRDFAGWQSQKHGNTVQDHIETAFERVCGTRLAVTGSGRTDSGVHALGQCAHVDVPAGQFPAERWLKALNGVLPPAIRILRGRFVEQSFHARFSAKGKVYRYRIINGAVRPPLEIGRAWHVPSHSIGSCWGERPNYSGANMISLPLPQIAEKRNEIPCGRWNTFEPRVGAILSRSNFPPADFSTRWCE